MKNLEFQLKFAQVELIITKNETYLYQVKKSVRIQIYIVEKGG